MPQRGVSNGPGYLSDDLETIDTSSGNVMYHIPLAKLTGRGGFSMSLGLSYNSNIYNAFTTPQMTPRSSLNNQTINVTQMFPNLPGIVAPGFGGWSYDYNYALVLEEAPRGTSYSCPQAYPGQWDRFKLRLVTPDGGAHELAIYGQNYNYFGGTQGYWAYDPWAADPVGIRSTATWSITRSMAVTSAWSCPMANPMGPALGQT